MPGTVYTNYVNIASAAHSHTPTLIHTQLATQITAHCAVSGVTKGQPQSNFDARIHMHVTYMYVHYAPVMIVHIKTATIARCQKTTAPHEPPNSSCYRVIVVSTKLMHSCRFISLINAAGLCGTYVYLHTL